MALMALWLVVGAVHLHSHSRQSLYMAASIADCDLHALLVDAGELAAVVDSAGELEVQVLDAGALEVVAVEVDKLQTAVVGKCRELQAVVQDDYLQVVDNQVEVVVDRHVVELQRVVGNQVEVVVHHVELLQVVVHHDELLQVVVEHAVERLQVVIDLIDWLQTVLDNVVDHCAARSCLVKRLACSHVRHNIVSEKVETVGLLEQTDTASTAEMLA